ncbi:unnamed protein product [Cuscuta campestris]|uniref:AIG1-type G domain-containing protein n=1 Tax=Cuscuta campestris TaxID=132261 RepID=A0A484M669_9ASTE|nr:unnamed protein product [Cuscuta campestris]
MESSVDGIDGSHLREANGVKDDLLELPLEEKVPDVSIGNEVFAEGIAAEIPSVGFVDGETVASKGRKDDDVDSTVGSLQDEKELDLIDEDETFEEAVEATIEDDEKFEEAVEAAPDVQSAHDDAGVKLEVLENKESAAQEDQHSSDKFARDETEQSEKFDNVVKGNVTVIEVSDFDATSETDTLLYTDKVNKKTIDVSKESEDGALYPGETIAFNAAKNGYDYENGAMTVDDSVNDVGAHEKLDGKHAIPIQGDGNSQKQAASYRDILLLSEKTSHAGRISDTTDTGLGFQDDVNTHNHKSVIPSADLRHEKCSDMEERASLLMESADIVGKNEERKDAHPNDILVNGESFIFNVGNKEIESMETESLDQGTTKGEQKDIQCSDKIFPGSNPGRSFELNTELKENELPHPASELLGETYVVSSHPPKDSTQSPSSNADNKHREHKVVQINNGVLDHQEGGLKLLSQSKEKVSDPDTGHDSGISVGYKATTPEVDSAHPFNDFTGDDVVASATFSNLAVDSSKHAQPQVVNATLDIPIAEVKEPDNKQVIYMEENQTVARTKQEDIKSATDSSSPATSVAHTTTPAGLGRAAPLLEPTPRVAQQPRVNGAVTPVQSQLIEESTNAEGEECDETREKLQMIRVKFLRLARRLGQTPHNVVVAQVLYRLGLAEQLRGSSGGRFAPFSFDRASGMAEQLEAAGQEPLNFSCTIMVLGKTGVGKSATINSIFDEGKFGTNAFQTGTKKVQDVVGTVQGIKVRVIDTPGLLPSWSDQRQNEKILRSVKNFIQKTPPDIVLYLDRLDMQSREYGDMPLLRTITDIFGPSIWFNAIVVLTHAASAPPEGPNGTATSYDMFVTQRSHAVQQAIRQAAGDMRLMNPVSLVENHSACRTNRAGQRVLPNGQVWKPHLLLLSFASKILAEANTLLKLQDSPPGRNFPNRSRSPPLPFLLSSLLQSRPQVKLPTEQIGDDETLYDDLDDSDSEDESEYDKLPPFKCLTKAQLGKLSKEQRKAYFDELEYREKLLMRKQLKEERRRRNMMKTQAATKDVHSNSNESADEDINGAASVPVPMPDLTLPASFDSDNPTHRYRCLDSSNQWLVRPVLDSQGWDHDIGYEGINVERMFVVKERIPISFSGQVSKDKKDSNLQMEMASSLKHGGGKVTSLGFDMQSLGKDVAYTFRAETKFINFRKNKASAGLSACLLGDALTAGVKVEDKLIVSKRGQVVISGGAMFGRGDVAYGGSLEATLRDKDHPLGRFLSTLGLSVMDWHGDLAIGCNSQTQIPVGRHTNLIGRVNINNRGSGQVSLRLTSSEQLQIALICLIPLARKIFGYSQSVQYS